MKSTVPTAQSAATELRTIRSNDPAAALALAAVRVTVHTLEQHWIRRTPDGPAD